MNIAARVTNRRGEHIIALTTDGREQSLVIPPKPDGFGSSANGGELLFLALATCYCNAIYREGRKRGISIESVHVEVSGEFGKDGEPARNIACSASVAANASEADVLELMRHTDTVPEIQNTLRCPPGVTLTRCAVRGV